MSIRCVSLDNRAVVLFVFACSPPHNECVIVRQAMGMGQDSGGDAAEDGRGSGEGAGGGEDDGEEGITLLYEEVG